jgi:hypothetical protein
MIVDSRVGAYPGVSSAVLGVDTPAETLQQWIYSVELDGSAQWLQNGTDWTALPDEFTIASWVRYLSWGGAFHGFWATGADSNNMLSVYSSGSVPQFTFDLELIDATKVLANNTAVATNWTLVTVTRTGSGPYNHTLWVNKTKVSTSWAPKLVDGNVLIGLYWKFALYQAMRIGRFARFHYVPSDGVIRRWVDQPRSGWGDAYNRFEFGDTPGDSSAHAARIQNVGTNPGAGLLCLNTVAGDTVVDSPP